MRITTKRTRFAEVAGLVAGAVSNKSTKRIFECLRLKTREGGLEVAGTDLAVAMRYRFAEDLQIDEPGEAVVRAQLFCSVLREIPDETLKLLEARRKLAIETDGGFFELECEDPGQFPLIPEFPEGVSCRLAASDLRDLVRKTTFAAGKEAARFVLNGVQLALGGDSLEFAATDGRRLAKLARPVERANGAEGRPLSAIVGVRGLQQFERVAAEVDGSVELALTEDYVALRAGPAEVIVRGMDGTFPDLSQIVPEAVQMEATIPVGPFVARLRQARAFARGEEARPVALSFEAGRLSIRAAGVDGRAEVSLGVEYDGEPLRIGFNPEFLLGALKVAGGEQVRFGFNGPDAAARMLDEEGFCYVVMPMLVE